MVRQKGVEPLCLKGQRILSPSCLTKLQHWRIYGGYSRIWTYELKRGQFYRLLVLARLTHVTIYENFNKYK